MQLALIYMKSRKTMLPKDQGLTVGELTIAISILIIAALIWTNISKNEGYDQSLKTNPNRLSLNQSPSVPYL